MATCAMPELGRPWPLGAHCIDGGVNFALFSAHAEKVELCLFSRDGKTELQRIALHGPTDAIWHIFVPGCEAGSLYGYRVHGPYEPWNGHRFNPDKLLVDPYARSFYGPLIESEENCGYLLHPEMPADDQADQTTSELPDPRDNAHNVPKCVVVDRSLRGDTGSRPLTALHNTVIYEAHVKGLSQLHPDVPASERGTYGAVASDAMLAHYKELGITAVELLPVHFFCDDVFLLDKHLVNYWGYNSLGFFSPDPRYARAEPAAEFCALVRRLHDNGIEVILDVVYNHTAEGNDRGPTLSFRGIDNKSYYRLADNPRDYVNDSGCGNTLNCDHPRVIQLVLDSLRYWVEDMGVDGFRFDLAPVLGREPAGFNPGAAFFKALQQDPVLSTVKLIAEPWDCGLGGYQTGNFPPGWSEWNDQYRDALRKFWNGDNNSVQDLAQGLHGSSAVFEWQRKRPQASVNFVTSHDGFTLADLVSYTDRHNEANLEGNQDGHHANYSSNYGVEGPVPDEHPNAPGIMAARELHRRNLLASLLLSQGVPMLLAGDELGRTQMGNNNAYCQDNALNWLDWQHQEQHFFRFACKLVHLRKRYPVLCQQRYLHGVYHSPSLARGDISWLNERGETMTEQDWVPPARPFLGLLLAGDAHSADVLVAGRRHRAHLLLLFNNSAEAVAISLPHGFTDAQLVLDTTQPELTDQLCAGKVSSPAHSVVVVASVCNEV